jgi:pilus assembly protein CpaF
MFGKRTSFGGNTPAPAPTPSAAPKPAPSTPKQEESADKSPTGRLPKSFDASKNSVSEEALDLNGRDNSDRSDNYFQTKQTIFAALIDSIDLSQLATMDAESAREEIRDIVSEIIGLKSIAMSISEQEDLLDDICNDVLGYGPLEPLLARDDIADIMVNGSQKCYIEVNGKVKLTNVRFRDDSHLMNICQRIVSQVGRRVDESSPICDARLPDGSRVNVIAPPLAIDGAALTIRKLKKDPGTIGQVWLDLP